MHGVEVGAPELTLSSQLLLAVGRSKVMAVGKLTVIKPPTGMGFCTTNEKK